MYDKMFDAAWAAARKKGPSRGCRAELAAASEATHPCEALEVHAERVVEFVNTGGNLAYAEATN